MWKVYLSHELVQGMSQEEEDKKSCEVWEPGRLGTGPSGQWEIDAGFSRSKSFGHKCWEKRKNSRTHSDITTANQSAQEVPTRPTRTPGIVRERAERDTGQCHIFLSLLLFLKTGIIMKPWLIWSLLSSSDWPWTLGDSLASAPTLSAFWFLDNKGPAWLSAPV